MERRTFPLEDLFYRLRDHGLPLGIAEYMAVVRALQAGVGVADRESLRQLCRAVWVKSDEEKLLFQRLSQGEPGSSTVRRVGDGEHHNVSVNLRRAQLDGREGREGCCVHIVPIITIQPHLPASVPALIWSRA